MGGLVAGVDSSTQSTTVVVVDADSGATVASGKAPHVVTGSDGARETDPELWWNALRDAIAATGRADEIRAISVAAQQHGLVVLDASLQDVPSVLYAADMACYDAKRAGRNRVEMREVTASGRMALGPV